MKPFLQMPLHDVPFEPGHVWPTEPTAQCWCLGFVQQQLLLPQGQTLLPTTPQWLSEQRHYLGRLEGLDAWVDRLDSAPPGWQALPLRGAMMGLPTGQMALASRAAQVLEWDRAHRFCGVCGASTERVNHERSRKCLACGHLSFPRLSPAMMALVWRPGEILLARSPHFAPGMYSALAGFVEPGESLEDCVQRECFEEVGVRVRELRYYGSQSWPFPHSLMLAFTARWQEGELQLQAEEIEDAQWFPVHALPTIPPRFSISGHLILDTVRALQEGRLDP